MTNTNDRNISMTTKIINPFTRYYSLRDNFYIYVIPNSKKLSIRVEKQPIDDLIPVNSRKDIFDWILNNPNIKKEVISSYIDPTLNYLTPDFNNLVACGIRGRGHTMALMNRRGMANVYIMSDDVYDIIRGQISPPAGYEEYSKKGITFVGYYDRGELMFVADNSLMPSNTCIYSYAVNHNQIHEAPFYVFYKDGKGYISPMKNYENFIGVMTIDMTEQDFYHRRMSKSHCLTKMLMSWKKRV